MDREAFDSLVTHMDTAMIVLTASDGRERAGCLVGFHTQCSIDPVRYCFWLSKANRTCRVALFASHFAVHFLDRADHDIAVLFGANTGDEVDKFADIEWQPGARRTALAREVPEPGRPPGRRAARRRR